MAKKQFIILVVVSFLGGIIGGVLSNQYFFVSAFAKNRNVSQIIEAKEFRVLGDNGKTKATFGIVKGGTDAGLDFIADDESSNEIHLSQTIGLFIKKGNSLSQIVGDGMTFDGHSYSTIFNSLGFEMRSTKTNKAEILQNIFGAPLLQVGLIRQGLESRGEYPGIRLADKSQKDRIIIHLLDTGEPFISLSDDYLKTRAVLGTISLKNYQSGSIETRAPSSLILFNESGNVIWKVP